MTFGGPCYRHRTKQTARMDADGRGRTWTDGRGQRADGNFFGRRRRGGSADGAPAAVAAAAAKIEKKSVLGPTDFFWPDRNFSGTRIAFVCTYINTAKKQTSNKKTTTKKRPSARPRLSASVRVCPRPSVRASVRVRPSLFTGRVFATSGSMGQTASSHIDTFSAVHD